MAIDDGGSDWKIYKKSFKQQSLQGEADFLCIYFFTLLNHLSLSKRDSGWSNLEGLSFSFSFLNEL